MNLHIQLSSYLISHGFATSTTTFSQESLLTNMDFAVHWYPVGCSRRFKRTERYHVALWDIPAGSGIPRLLVHQDDCWKRHCGLNDSVVEGCGEDAAKQTGWKRRWLEPSTLHHTGEFNPSQHQLKQYDWKKFLTAPPEFLLFFLVRLHQFLLFLSK